MSEISSSQFEMRKKIVHKYLQNPTISRIELAKEFNKPRSTIYRIISRYNASLSLQRKPGSGCRAGMKDRNLQLKVIRSIKQNPGLSDNDRAKRYGTSKTTVRRIRIKAGYEAYRVIKIPNRSDKQNISISPNTMAVF